MYKRIRNQQAIKRLRDGAIIPNDPANRDWQDFLNWINDGNVPEPEDPEPPPTQDELDAQAVRAYPKLRALIQMTPAQIQAWVDANINTAADMKDAIKTLAVAIGVLARRI